MVSVALIAAPELACTEPLPEGVRAGPSALLLSGSKPKGFRPSEDLPKRSLLIHCQSASADEALSLSLVLSTTGPAPSLELGTAEDHRMRGHVQSKQWSSPTTRPPAQTA